MIRIINNKQHRQKQRRRRRLRLLLTLRWLRQLTIKLLNKEIIQSKLYLDELYFKTITKIIHILCIAIDFIKYEIT